VLKVSSRIAKCLFLALALSANCYAVVVKNLYSAEVSVADKTQAALTVGSREALSEVFVKVSGRTDVLQNSVLQAALGNSRGLVQQYAYTRQADESGELQARFEFDVDVISDLVASAGVPLWTANRPSVLVWMVLEGAQGKQYLNRETSAETMAWVKEDFARRGVPVQFPLYDLNDAAAISVDELWRLNAGSLAGASQRYGVNDILAGRLAALSDGSWVGDWSYFSGHTRIDRSIRAGGSEAFLQAGASLVAQEMSSRYAVAPSSGNAGGVKVLVTGVSSYSDYASIVAWLEGLELIEHANVEAIRGDTIQLDLAAQADAQQLSAIIELNKRLVPVHSPSPDVQLSYQWRR
jgi:hypothetical protein